MASTRRNAQLYGVQQRKTLSVDTRSTAYRDLVLEKVKQKYTEAIPNFTKRLDQRFAVENLFDAQCRLCGLKNKVCSRIFENDTLASLVNTYMPIKVTKVDQLPLTVCLECLGVLQSVDDLAYRSYLVEACLLQHYNDYKDTSIFVDKPQETHQYRERTSDYPLHLRLSEAKKRPHPADVLGFPAKRKGSFLKRYLYNDAHTLKNYIEGLKTLPDKTQTPTVPSSPDVVKNNLKNNLQKILLNSAPLKQLGKDDYSISVSDNSENPMESSDVIETVDLTDNNSVDHKFDHSYSVKKSSQVIQSPMKHVTLGIGPGKSVVLPSKPIPGEKLRPDQIRNIANAALAEMDKEDQTLLNLSEILTNQNQNLDEPVFIILVNDEEQKEASSQKVSSSTTKIVELDVEEVQPDNDAPEVEILGTQDVDAAESDDVTQKRQGTTDKTSALKNIPSENAKDVNYSLTELNLAEKVESNINPDDELAKFSESLQTEQIKRWFTIQILKTSSDGNEDLLDKSDGMMLVTYVVYYSKISGKLVPHHFSLMNDNFSEITRRRAYSIISTMLKEEKNRVLKYLESQKNHPPKTVKKPLVNRTTMKKPFRTTCLYCSKTMKEEELTPHTLENHMIQCTMCRVYVNSEDELIYHKEAIHGQEFVECDSCQKRFSEEEDKFFCSHQYTCSVCKKEFDSWPEYLNHEKIHFNYIALKFMRDLKSDYHRSMGIRTTENDKPLAFPCPTCGKRHEKKAEMERCDHLYDCRICRNSFSNYPLFVTHGCVSNPDLLRIIGPKKFQKKVIIQCSLCQDQFDDQKAYLSHYYSCALKHGIQVDLATEVKSLQTNSPVKCIFCQESFKSIFIFELHYSLCFKTRSIECRDCEEIIPTANRVEHAKVCCSNICCDFCGATFESKRLYRQHLRQQLDGSTRCATVTEEAAKCSFNGYISESFDPNNCHVCGRIFVSGHLLDRHIKSVHLGIEKSCPLCGTKFQKFNSVTMFLKHRKVHPEDELMEVSTGDYFGTYKCANCDKGFASKILKLIHEIYHHDKPLYKCSMCETEFISYINVKSHEATCKARQKDKSVYTCEHCGKTFTKLNMFQQHVENHDVTYTCDQCEKTFKKRMNLNKHKEVAHSSTPATCDVCGKTFTCEKYCKIHKRNLHSGLQFLCQVCGKTFHNQKRLTLHSSVHSGLKPHKCRYCEKFFRTQSIRNIHEEKHKNVFKYECNYCGHKFSRFINLYVHKRKVHADKCTYQCLKCGCGYNDQEFYNNHIKSCRGRKRKRTEQVRSSSCEYCHKTFASSRCLKAHYAPACETGTFICSKVTCCKRFDSDCSLKMHEKVHASDKFPCKMCGEAFLGMKQLELHCQLKHNETFVYHCSYCGRGYNFEKFLKKHVKYCNESLQQLAHINIKSKKPIVKCDNCGKIFAKFKDLRVHLTIVHGSDTYKDYPCRICDSKYDSYLQLSKHSKHHFKDLTNPGSYCCPKCSLQCSQWDVMMNHVCGEQLPANRENMLSGSFEMDCDPQVSSRPRRSQRKGTSKANRDELLPHQLVSTSYSRNSRGSHKSAARSIKYAPSSPESEQEEYVEKYVSDDGGSEHNAPATDEANLIYHCSFCSSNFDHIVTLQNHLQADHNLSLSNLEFQLVE